MRQLAYEHALALLPERAPLRTYFDALQLEMLCGTPPPGAAGALHPDSAVEGSEEGWPPPRADSAGTAAGGLHVDAAAGSDLAGDGSIHRPFMSLPRALQAARAAKTDAAAPPPAIILHAGVHYLNETLVLGVADSGQVITNLPGAEAWLAPDETVTFLQSPSPSLLIRLIKVEGGASRMTVSSTARRGSAVGCRCSPRSGRCTKVRTIVRRHCQSAAALSMFLVRQLIATD